MCPFKARDVVKAIVVMLMWDVRERLVVCAADTGIHKRKHCGVEVARVLKENVLCQDSQLRKHEAGNMGVPQT